MRLRVSYVCVKCGSVLMQVTTFFSNCCLLASFSHNDKPTYGNRSSVEATPVSSSCSTLPHPNSNTEQTHARFALPLLFNGANAFVRRPVVQSQFHLLWYIPAVAEVLCRFNSSFVSHFSGPSRAAPVLRLIRTVFLF